ncbi:MAG: tyrosine-protein phosphatase [Phycisphaerales bacterium]|nr:MAG: tyrosine-protein phosphatase [Phycisphaerales bacterium]
MKNRRPILLAALSLGGLAVLLAAWRTGILLRPTAGMNDTRTADHPAASTWAQPLTLPGVPNLHRVSPGLFRGAQPTAEGMEQLPRLGITTIVNLRSLHSDRDEIGALPLDYEHIAMKTWEAEDEEVVRFLRIVTNPSRGPVFVHCQRGADRTGTMCAIYRVVIQGWTKDQAVAEMTQGGFGFYEGWQNLIDYVRHLDVERIEAQAGLSTN